MLADVLAPLMVVELLPLLLVVLLVALLPVLPLVAPLVAPLVVPLVALVVVEPVVVEPVVLEPVVLEPVVVLAALFAVLFVVALAVPVVVLPTAVVLVDPAPVGELVGAALCAPLPTLASPTKALKFATPLAGALVIFTPVPIAPEEDLTVTGPVNPPKVRLTRLMPAGTLGKVMTLFPMAMDTLAGYDSRAMAKMLSSRICDGGYPV